MKRVHRVAFSIAVIGCCFATKEAFANGQPPSCASLASMPPLAGNTAIVGPISAVVPASGTNKAYCNVTFTYSKGSGPADGYAPGESQAIRIGIGLPLNTTDGGTGGVQGAWNGRVQNLGGGGLNGNVGSPVSATNAGYVGSSTDSGHTAAQNGCCGNWGVIQATHQLDRGKIEDFGYEGVHQQVVWAKALTKTYYSKSPSYSYWNGCSEGGRQGLTLAQQLPAHEQLDGYVIGAPAMQFAQIRTQQGWPFMVVQADLVPKGKTLTTAQGNAVQTAAINACQSKNLSGLPNDGYLDEPRSCKFSAVANICGKPGAPASPNCLDADQAAAVDRIMAGPFNRKGTRMWWPMPWGSTTGSGIAGGFTSNGSQQMFAWNHMDININPLLLFTDMVALAAAGNPPGGITVEDEMVLSANLDYPTEAQSLDLDNVRDTGGKIVMWQGTADNSTISWILPVAYYRKLAVHYDKGPRREDDDDRGYGGRPDEHEGHGHGDRDDVDYGRLQSFFRYFPAPGASHCNSGLGAKPDDPLSALVNWVEKGEPPRTLIATGGSVNPARSRPLCPYPTAAVYNGFGDPNVASSFHCGGDRDTKENLCALPVARFKHEDRRGTDAHQLGISEEMCRKAD